MSSRGGAATAADTALQQVNQFWSMLDDLCESDPSAYDRFIHKQMEGATSAAAGPQLHSCISTRILDADRGLLYVNICSWKRVPAPQEPTQPFPVYAGKLETDTNQSQGSFTIVDIALSPAVLEEHKDDKSEVYLLALRFAEQHHNLRLSQQYTVISCSPKSSQDDLHRRFGFQERRLTTKPLNTDCKTPADLLRQISSLRSEERDQQPTARPTENETENKKKNFIQVISSTFLQPETPQHQLELKSDAAGVPHSVELTVELPKVCSISECQLRISKDDVLLEVEDVYYLLFQFPNAVNEDAATAVFNKRKRRLTLTVDVL